MMNEDDKPAALALARLDRIIQLLTAVVVLLIGLALGCGALLFVIIRLGG